MAKGIIRLCYKKMIDVNAQKQWEKHVFEDTYMEFFMQSQFYNQEEKYPTFQELIANVPAADKLHYLVSTAAINYIRQLNDLIPDITNAHHQLCLPFKNFRFEIVQSHNKNKEEHIVAIYFYSEPIIWIDTIDNQLLISYSKQKEALGAGNEISTDLISLQLLLSISSFQTI
ncbi:hypothetical protein [Emticicia sp. BO119]|uniref:hypothetical protein n=1 Tax=Emticicia sp. BO119 TaxID=2757768 RepID=UPI0015F02485|nr:hypothetical protein [Emticicia sp. BO119]MBA4853486.1 hypothetical protein [Emticicia sp. BO119]